MADSIVSADTASTAKVAEAGKSKGYSLNIPFPRPSKTKQPPTSSEDVVNKEIVIDLIQQIAKYIKDTTPINSKISDVYVAIGKDSKIKDFQTKLVQAKLTSANPSGAKAGGAANHEEGLHSLEEPISSIKKPKKKPQK
jgi:hypothetical protein